LIGGRVGDFIGCDEARKDLAVHCGRSSRGLNRIKARRGRLDAALHGIQFAFREDRVKPFGGVRASA